MIGQAQQVKQRWKGWIHVKELAAARHFDTIAFSIRAYHARLGVGCKLLKHRQLSGIELGSERFQNRAEILIEHP